MYNDILGPKKKKPGSMIIHCPECKKPYTVFERVGKKLKESDKICAYCLIKKWGK